MNNDLIIFIIIIGVTISAVILAVLHANDEIFPGDAVLYASQLIHQIRNTETILIPL